jgi:hypothetical protein
MLLLLRTICWSAVGLRFLLSVLQSTWIHYPPFLRMCTSQVCSLRNTISPTAKDRSKQCLSACFFIRSYARISCCRNRLVITSRSCSQYSRSGTEQAAAAEMPKCRGGWPYNASNGDLPRAEWNDVFYQNSAKGNQRNHLVGQACRVHLKKVSMHWLRRSVCPSVCGW